MRVCKLLYVLLLITISIMILGCRPAGVGRGGGDSFAFAGSRSGVGTLARLLLTPFRPPEDASVRCAALSSLVRVADQGGQPKQGRSSDRNKTLIISMIMIITTNRDTARTAHRTVTIRYVASARPTLHPPTHPISGGTSGVSKIQPCVSQYD